MPHFLKSVYQVRQCNQTNVCLFEKPVVRAVGLREAVSEDISSQSRVSWIGLCQSEPQLLLMDIWSPKATEMSQRLTHRLGTVTSGYLEKKSRRLCFCSVKRKFPLVPLPPPVPHCHSPAGGTGGCIPHFSPQCGQGVFPPTKEQAGS